MLGLTPRQFEVLMLLARGLPAKIIGRRLNVSVATVKSHTSAIYRALRVRGKVEAVHVARRRGVCLEAVKGRAQTQREPLHLIAIENSTEALVPVESDN
ncbi:Nitrate/nitrite response regulator protein NarL [compost metagenome]